MIEEKITKLLRLSACGGASPAEAETALAAAMRLADEHRVDLDSLRRQIAGEDSRAASACTHRTVRCHRGTGVAERLAARALQTFFHVEAIASRQWDDKRGIVSEMIIAGLPTDVEIATHVFIYLCRVMRGSWEIARAKDKRLKQKAYLHGMAQGLFSKLREIVRTRQAERPDSAACSAIQASVTAYVDATWPGQIKTTTAKPYNPARAPRSAQAGWAAGRHVNIHDTLATAAQTATPALS